MKIKRRHRTIIFSVDTTKNIVLGRQTRCIVPACSFLVQKDIQKYAYPSGDHIVIEIPKQSVLDEVDHTEIPNIFVQGEYVHVKEPFYKIKENDVDGVLYEVDHKCRFSNDLGNIYEYTGNSEKKHFSAIYLPDKYIRIHLLVEDCGILYFNENLCHYKEEGYNSPSERVEAWDNHYKGRKDFLSINNPICFWSNFSIKLDGA